MIIVFVALLYWIVIIVMIRIGVVVRKTPSGHPDKICVSTQTRCLRPPRIIYHTLPSSKQRRFLCSVSESCCRGYPSAVHNGHGGCIMFFCRCRLPGRTTAEWAGNSPWRPPTLGSVLMKSLASPGSFHTDSYRIAERHRPSEVKDSVLLQQHMLFWLLCLWLSCTSYMWGCNKGSVKSMELFVSH